MPRIRKKTSKRGTTHQRTKIRQKVRETHKKNKKEAKKNTQWKSKHKKDPGIPSSLPFKEDILAEIEATRRQVEEDKQRRKDAKLQAGTAPVPGEPAATSTSVFTSTFDDDTPPTLIDSSLPNLEAVIDSAHAVLCVLDARDPLSFRSARLEEALAKKDKQLIIVLTKTDLVPREVLAGWLAHLRAELPSVPVIPFRASEAFIQTAIAKGKQKASLESVSKDSLLSAVAGATKSHPGQGTRVAVVGLTNSGKSTLLNSLLSASSLPTYKPSIQQPKKATFQTTTEGAQPVQLTHDDRAFTFIDTPGMSVIQFNAQPGSRKLTPEEVETSKAKDLLLRNRGSFVHWKETDAAAAYIVSRAKHQDLMLHYNVPAFTPGDVPAFLGGVARASGRIRKHGVLDLGDTARSIARDWSLGNLPYFALPPALSASAPADPALDACLTLKEARAPPRAWPVQLDSGALDERDVDLEAPYAVQGVESVARRKRVRMEVDESEDEEGEDEDEEMGSAESGSDEDGDEDEIDEDEIDDDDEDESDEEESDEEPPQPAPKSKKVSKTQPKPVTKPKPAPSKLKPASKPKPAPTPRRIGNIVAGGAKKAKVVSFAGEESYDFTKFF